MAFQTLRLCILIVVSAVCASCGGGGGATETASVATPIATPPAVPDATQVFEGNILLAAPTDTSIKMLVLTPRSGALNVAYQSNLAMQDIQMAAGMVTSGVPKEIQLTGLKPNTRYTYKLTLQTSTGNLV